MITNVYKRLQTLTIIYKNFLISTFSLQLSPITNSLPRVNLTVNGKITGEVKISQKTSYEIKSLLYETAMF